MFSLNGVGMEIEQIEAKWNKDRVINRDDLAVENLNIPYLHDEYRKVYTRESLALYRMISELKTLKLDKYEHYTQGGSQEAARQGWKLPPIGKVLKTDVEKYLEADVQIIEANLKIAYQQEKVDYLKSILDMISQRQWQIKGALDYMKFQAGGNVAN